jgi:hypothetical protein
MALPSDQTSDAIETRSFLELRVSGNRFLRRTRGNTCHATGCANRAICAPAEMPRCGGRAKDPIETRSFLELRVSGSRFLPWTKGNTCHAMGCSKRAI